MGHVPSGPYIVRPPPCIYSAITVDVGGLSLLYEHYYGHPDHSVAVSQPSQSLGLEARREHTASQPHIHTKLIGLAEDEDIDSTYREQLLQEQ